MKTNKERTYWDGDRTFYGDAAIRQQIDALEYQKKIVLSSKGRSYLKKLGLCSAYTPKSYAEKLTCDIQDLWMELLNV